MVIHPLGAELSHAGGRTDIGKQIDACRNFANPPSERFTNTHTILILKISLTNSNYIPPCVGGGHHHHQGNFTS